MREKIKKNKITVIIIILVLILISLGIWWYQNQRGINYCKDNCFYISPKEPSGGIISGSDKGGYWKYKDRKFESQEQCADYCLRNK